MAANNEIGTIEPIAEAIGAVCRRARAWSPHRRGAGRRLHAAQCRQPMHIDMLSLSAPQVPRPEGRGASSTSARA
ncbi:MAG: hypothetical protein ACLUHE_02345 [Christensenellales bacterium]